MCEIFEINTRTTIYSRKLTYLRNRLGEMFDNMSNVAADNIAKKSDDQELFEIPMDESVTYCISLFKEHVSYGNYFRPHDSLELCKLTGISPGKINVVYCIFTGR